MSESDDPVRAMYKRLAAAHKAKPAVPDLGGGVVGDKYPLSEQLDLDAIEARANAATPGPWVWEDWNTEGDPTTGPEPYTLTAPPEADPEWRSDRLFPNLRYPIIDAHGSDGILTADAEFIAHAREDIPKLIKRIRELEKYRFTVLRGK